MQEADTIPLRVVKARIPDTARDIVRIDKRHRNGIGRYDIVQLSAEGRSCYVAVLGTEDEGVIEMDLDTRLELGVMYDQVYDFTMRRAGRIGQLRWYLNSNSPTVWIPAWLALWSVLLGGTGTIFGLIGLVLAALR